MCVIRECNSFRVGITNNSHLYVYCSKNLGLGTVRLSDLKVKQSAIIKHVHRTVDGTSTDMIASRLETLGFVAGTKVQVITKGLFGGDPILIQVGFTRFALRKVEAEKVEIQGVSA